MVDEHCGQMIRTFILVRKVMGLTLQVELA